jgi:hypothetical protein
VAYTNFIPSFSLIDSNLTLTCTLARPPLLCIGSLSRYWIWLLWYNSTKYLVWYDTRVATV